MGKTGLIQFCYDKPEIADEYYTFFIDILHTSSLREFTYLLGRAIYETLLPRSRKMASLFILTIKSISGKFGFDPITGMPTFNVELGDIDRPEYTLDEIFQYLAHADKPCIVAIDEFQQIAKYPEKNIEAQLRTHIQKLRNCNFIFAGSERHMMQEMFTSAARPFYHSADMLELKAIVPEIYIPFIAGHFKKRNRRIASDDIERVYNLFKGHTYYVQKAFNEAFADTPEGEECTLETIRAAIDNMVASNDTIFREILSNIPEKQKELLYAIAKEGERMGNLYGTGFKHTPDGSILVDESGLPVADPTLVKLGNYNPDFILGWSNSLRYKGFTLDFLLDWHQGGVFVSRTFGMGMESGVLKQTEDRTPEHMVVKGECYDAATDQYVANTKQVSPRDYYRNLYRRYHETQSTFSATFLKLREVSIGYDLPKRWLSHTPIKALNLSVVGRNLWMWTKGQDMVDPEAVTYEGNSVTPGVEEMSYPTMRSLGFSVHATF